MQIIKLNIWKSNLFGEDFVHLSLQDLLGDLQLLGPFSEHLVLYLQQGFLLLHRLQLVPEAQRDALCNLTAIH
jgi:hypothetical protein